MHVKVNYPDAVMQIREIKCSVKAGDIIGEKLENHIQELDDNITVKESRKSGIERRERILNIQPSSSSDLETRKIAVIARWCISTMYTERILQKRLQSMLGDGYNLEVNIQQKTVSVTLQLKHYKNRKVIWERTLLDPRRKRPIPCRRQHRHCIHKRKQPCALHALRSGEQNPGIPGLWLCRKHRTRSSIFPRPGI